MKDPQEKNNDAILHIPLDNENLWEELNFYYQLSDTFKEYGKDTDELDFIISQLQSQIEWFNSEKSSVSLPDRQEIERLIRNHPYFRNPSSYPIRLLTILKYLRKSGINVHYKDIDIYVDSIMTGMEEVRKTGRGLYMSTK